VEGIVKTGHPKFKAGWWLLLLSSFLLTGCVEIFFFSHWHQPPTSYIEPVAEKTTGENRPPF
jgi:hypothetical protein